MNAATETKPAATLTLANADEMMDLTAELCRNPSRRDSAMLAAHRANLTACECCGKAIKNFATATRIAFTDGTESAHFGPECAKRIPASYGVAV